MDEHLDQVQINNDVTLQFSVVVTLNLLVDDFALLVLSAHYSLNVQFCFCFLEYIF